MGRPLDRYCDDHRLNVRERLELFLKVCAPVAYAHRNLVVHRDLKPSNILVTADGRPMLLDFGTSKLLGADGTHTATVLPMLTFRYSSPEQRLHGPINTSSDVFSLGVILYELLTGAWPFGNPASRLEHLDRLTRETPMLPPQSVVTEQAAVARGTTVRALASSLAGDLSNVLGKALAPVPELRYDSVQSLSDDIGNWLAGFPVNAKPPSIPYRAGKFLRRRWLPVTAAMVIISGMAGLTGFALSEARLARAEAVKSENVNEFLYDMLSSVGEGSFDPQKFTVAQMLDAAVPRLESAWKDDPLTEAALRMNLGASYVTLQKSAAAKKNLEMARATFQRLGRKREEARALYLLAVNASESGQLVASAAYYRTALEVVNSLGKDAPPVWVFRIKQGFADVLGVGMGKDEAERLFREAIALGERESSIPRIEVSNARTQLGGRLMNQGKTAEAEGMFRQSLAEYNRQKYHGTLKAEALYYLAILKSRSDDFPAARDFSRAYYETLLSNLGPDHRRTVQARIMWARFRAETGDTREAAEQVLEALPMVRKAVPPGSMSLWTPLFSASRTLNLAGRFVEAEPLAREQLSVLDRQHLPERDARRASSVNELGDALAGQKKYGEALPVFQRAEQIYSQLGPAWAARAEQERKKIEPEHGVK